MGEPKFTPGPWRKAIGGNLGNSIEAFRGPAGEHDDGYRSIALYQACTPNQLWAAQDENASANGSLIAAAPELYEALEQTWRVLDAAGLIHLSAGVQLGGTVWFVKASDAERASKAALAKARGEQP